MSDRQYLTEFLSFDQKQVAAEIKTRLGISEAEEEEETREEQVSQDVFSKETPQTIPAGLQGLSQFSLNQNDNDPNNAADFFGSNSSASFNQSLATNMTVEQSESKGAELTRNVQQSMSARHNSTKQQTVPSKLKWCCQRTKEGA